MFCKNCGSPIKDGDVFCGNCGQPVDSSANSGINRGWPQLPQKTSPSFMAIVVSL